MPDSWLVTGNLGWGTLTPGPTSLELASYCIADEGIDFDFGSLFRNSYVENPAFDGGRLGLQQSGVRRFRFPMRLASSWPGPGGLSGLAEFLRRIVQKPGHPSAGFIDLLPQNASYPIRFDIIDGRLDLRQYSVHRQRIARQDYDLTLDVQPFGYMPTSIVLGSAAQASGQLMTLNLPQGSILGDVPGLAEVAMSFAFASGNASNLVNSMWDGAYWTMAPQVGQVCQYIPSLLAAATSFSQMNNPSMIVGATHLADPMAPAGVVMQIAITPTFMATIAPYPGGFAHLLGIPGQGDFIGKRGPVRIIGYFRSSPSHAVQWQLVADVIQNSANTFTPLGTHNPVATLISQSHGSYGGIAPSAFQVLDFGEHVLPAISASGTDDQWRIRIFIGSGTTNMGIAAPLIQCGGLLTLPAGPNSGVMPGGIIWPSAGANSYTLAGGRLVIDGINRRLFVGQYSGSDYALNSGQFGDARIYHFGDYPTVATARQLLVAPFVRVATPLASSLGRDAPKLFLGSAFTGASVRYRPRFAFLRGL